jgi:hypothetical protein
VRRARRGVKGAGGGGVSASCAWCHASTGSIDTNHEWPCRSNLSQIPVFISTSSRSRSYSDGCHLTQHVGAVRQVNANEPPMRSAST